MRDERVADGGRDPEEDHALAALLREGGAAGTSEGAAARIAAGAWDLAGERRRARSLFPLRRTAWTAAAAAGLLAAAVLPGVAPPAFAVEGGPVQVWGGGDWTEADRVPMDRWVFVAGEGRGLVGPSAETRLRPGSGALFRIFRSATAPEPWLVEVASGRVGLEGRVRGFAAGSLQVLPAPGDAVLEASIEVSGEPVVAAARGGALVRFLSSEDSILLGEGESATVIRGRRLARLRPWDDAVAGEIALGCPLADAFPAAEGSVRILLSRVSGPWQAVEIPGDRAGEALETVNAAMGVWARRVRGEGVRASVRPPGLREIVHERDGRVTRLLVGGPRVVLERDGVREEFAGLRELRRTRPEEAALFAEVLHR